MVVCPDRRRVRPSDARVRRWLRARLEGTLALETDQDLAELAAGADRDVVILETAVGNGHELVPLRHGDGQVHVRLRHRPAGVPLRAAGHVAHDLRHQELEPYNDNIKPT